MYETAIELWKQYKEGYSEQWVKDDPRHALWAEVHNRLGQLDIILDLVRKSIREFSGDPEKARERAIRDVGLHKRLMSNELTMEEFLEQTASPLRSAEENQKFLENGNEVHLFTEMFYFVAWRIGVILAAKKAELTFPGLPKFAPVGINKVRNQLLEHPERAPIPNYRQSLMITDDGPVLKSMGVSMVGARARALDDTVDKGLYVNADEFRSELEIVLAKALA